MQLKIYNSKSNKKEIFEPVNKNKIGIYVCGPTVYNEIHVGNARSAIVFDILCRILKKIYNEVVYVKNITDIDDKIIQKAKEEGKRSSEIAKLWEISYLANCKKLNLMDPTYQPRATDSIKEIIDFILELIANGYAYEKDGNVFFDVSQLDSYGSLSKNNSSNVIEGHRIDLNQFKDNQQDFVLWKPSKEVYEPYWNSPWGKGRPGWHIECSAMSKKFLGINFDVHAGGSDLIFPHHENEQAQNFGCNGEGSGPKYWMHNAMLLLGSDKMSKSIGNIILLSEAFKRFHPVFLKFYILNTHYRHILSWSEESILSLANKYDSWIMNLGFYFKNESNIQESDLNELLNDLNTPGFFVNFEERLNKALKESNEEELIILANLLKFLGLDVEVPQLSDEIKNLAELRHQNKLNQEYENADKIRKEIEKEGFYIIDSTSDYKIKPKFKSILG